MLQSSLRTCLQFASHYFLVSSTSISPPAVSATNSKMPNLDSELSVVQRNLYMTIYVEIIYLLIIMSFMANYLGWIGILQRCEFGLKQKVEFRKCYFFLKVASIS
jgi:hypothetical protein